jgi:hypothetical protein
VSALAAGHGFLTDEQLVTAIRESDPIVWPSRSESAFQSAVAALAEGRLADAELGFLETLETAPSHEMANWGLKDVVRGRVLANRS